MSTLKVGDKVRFHTYSPMRDNTQDEVGKVTRVTKKLARVTFGKRVLWASHSNFVRI